MHIRTQKGKKKNNDDSIALLLKFLTPQEPEKEKKRFKTKQDETPGKGNEQGPESSVMKKTNSKSSLISQSRFKLEDADLEIISPMLREIQTLSQLNKEYGKRGNLVAESKRNFERFIEGKRELNAFMKRQEEERRQKELLVEGSSQFGISTPDLKLEEEYTVEA